MDAYEAAACGLLTTSADGTIEQANRTLCKWTGYAREELTKKRFQDLLTMGSKLFHQTHWMPLLQMQGSVAEVQLEMVDKDGRVLPILVNAAFRDPPARSPVDIALFVASDRRKYERELLAARRRAERSEAEFRTLADNSPDGILRVDRDRRVAYLSAANARLTNHPLADIVGRRFDELGLALDPAARWAEAIESAFRGEQVTFSWALAGRALETSLVPERDEAGQVASVLGITRDVSALRVEERSSRERAMFAEQLIGIVSHDLRNPLNAVLLGAHMLRSTELTQAAQEKMLDRISSAGQRANRLITELLDFTQARLGGGLRVAAREMDLHATTADCVEEIKLAWPGRMIEHRRIGDGRASGDPDRLAQVVTNLVNNALTYGVPERPVTITSATRAGAAELSVHNEGRPIAPEALARIFEPMRRGDHEVKLGSRSVGLGLYIVREIAAAHGGRVEVRSSEAEGTTFFVTFPQAG